MHIAAQHEDESAPFFSFELLATLPLEQVAKSEEHLSKKKSHRGCQLHTTVRNYRDQGSMAFSYKSSRHSHATAPTASPTALHVAAEANDAVAVKALLRGGTADPNARVECRNFDDGATALHLAAQKVCEGELRCCLFVCLFVSAAAAAAVALMRTTECVHLQLSPLYPLRE